MGREDAEYFCVPLLRTNKKQWFANHDEIIKCVLSSKSLTALLFSLLAIKVQTTSLQLLTMELSKSINTSNVQIFTVIQKKHRERNIH